MRHAKSDSVDQRHFYFESSMPVVWGMAKDSGSGDIYDFRSAYYGYTEAIYHGSYRATSTNLPSDYLDH